jgi:hypothetical protein
MTNGVKNMNLNELIDLAKSVNNDIRVLEARRSAVSPSNHGNSLYIKLSRKLEYKRKLCKEVCQDIDKLMGAA